MGTVLKTSGKTIAVNSIIGWVRLGVTTVATLFATRYALMALGVEGYGVYVAVASLPLFLSFVTGAAQVTAQAALGRELEAGDPRSAFQAAVLIHGAFALAIVLIGEILGRWLVLNVLQVPESMSGAAVVAVRVSILSASIGALLAPYESLLQIHERFGLFAALDMVRATALAVVSFALISYSDDRLVAYSVVVAALTVMTALLGFVIAKIAYPEITRWAALRHCLPALRSQLGLLTWTSMGGLAAVTRNQGYAILMNVFFGPQGSAAYGVASQVLGLVRQLAASVLSAFAPQILRRGNSEHVADLVNLGFQASKYVFLITVGAALALLVGMDTLLEVWLGDAPNTTMLLALLLISSLMVDQLSSGMIYVHLAIHRIAAVQVVGSILMIASLGLSIIAAEIGMGISWIFGILILMTVLIATIRVTMLRYVFPHAPQRWMRETVFPCLYAVAIPASVGFIINQTMGASLLQLIVSLIVVVCLLCPSIFFIALSPLEREILLKVLNQVTPRFRSTIA